MLHLHSARPPKQLLELLKLKLTPASIQTVSAKEGAVSQQINLTHVCVVVRVC